MNSRNQGQPTDFLWMSNATLNEEANATVALADLTSVVPSEPLKLLCAVVSAVFPPEYTFSGRVSEQVAQALANDGHEVRVFAPFPNRPGGTLFPGYKRAFSRKTKNPSEYELVHCFNTLAPDSRMLPRLIENLSFGISSG